MTALSHIRLDDGPTGMRSNFERTVAFLLPTDPVTKKRGAKRPGAEVSAVEAPNKHEEKGGKKVTFKQTTGKTGVEFRYYTKPEFIKLSRAQKDELRENRKKHSRYQGTWTGKADLGKGVSGSNSQQVTKGQVAALIREHEEKKQNDAKEHDALK